MLKRKFADESGQAVVLGALAMTVLLGFVSLGTEVGMLFVTQQSEQAAADSAAITGAQEMSYGDMTSAAKSDAARNGYTDGSDGVTVTVNDPPLNGPNAGTSGFVEVIIAKQQPTLFMALLGKSSMTVEARAVATMGTTNNCVYALNSTGTDISVSNGANVSLPSCDMYGESSNSKDLNVTGGATLSAAGIGLVGGSSITNGGRASPTPVSGAAPVSDPLAFLSPPSYQSSSCVAGPPETWQNETIGPTSGGTVCWNGLTIGEGATITLNPGMYIINGVLNFGGGATIKGTGVTFYLPPGASLSIGNGANENLTAPTSGTYDGILFYQDRSNTTAESLVGGANSSFQGIMYFPKASFTFSNGSNTSTYASIVAGSLSFTGGSTVKNYALVNSSTPLSSARVVE